MKLEGSLNIRQIRTFKLNNNECPIRATQRPMGWTYVNDPANLTDAEIEALIKSWEWSALKIMQTYCGIKAPNCPVLVLISAENFELSVTPNPNGPPHRMFLEGDITFECARGI